MIKELVISITAKGYILRRSTKEEKGVTYYEEVLNSGTFSDLLFSLRDIPEDFYQGEFKTTYSNSSFPLVISEEGQRAITSQINLLKKTALENILIKKK